MSNSSSTSPAETVFRPNGFAAMFILFVFGAVTAVLLTLLLKAFGYTLPGVISWTFLQLLCLIYVWAMVCTPVCLWVLTVRTVGTDIEGRTFWGAKRRIDSSGITRVQIRGPRRWGFWVVHDAAAEPPLWISRAVRNSPALEMLFPKSSPKD